MLLTGITEVRRTELSITGKLGCNYENEQRHKHDKGGEISAAGILYAGIAVCWLHR